MAYKQREFDAGNKPVKTPSREKQAEMAKKGLAWDDGKKIWIKAWKGDE